MKWAPNLILILFLSFGSDTKWSAEAWPSSPHWAAPKVAFFLLELHSSRAWIEDLQKEHQWPGQALRSALIMARSASILFSCTSIFFRIFPRVSITGTIVIDCSTSFLVLSITVSPSSSSSYSSVSCTDTTNPNPFLTILRVLCTPLAWSWPSVDLLIQSLLIN